MNAMNFTSAYEQLQPSERGFVDDFIRSLEREAEKRFERITTTLQRLTGSLDFETMERRVRENFAKPMVRAAIYERANTIAAERDLTPDRIIREHAAIGLANMRDYVEIGQDGLPSLDMTNASRVDWSAVQELDIVEEYGRSGNKKRVKLKLWNKQVSLDALAKWAGLDKADNPEYIAYRELPSDQTQIPASANVETLAEEYAKFIDG